MKHLNIRIMGVVLAGMSVFASCSKNDNPVEMVSRTVQSIDIYSGADDVFKKESTYRFIYNDRKLVKVENDRQASEITYTYYAADSLSYSDIREVGSTVEWNKISAKLKDGKIRSCYSNKMGFMTYSYENNFVTSAMVGSNLILDYEWDKNNLYITSKGLPGNGYFNTSYVLSNVLNNYSIDLNVLSQLVDNRENYTDVMNTYGQMIGILGTKNPYILENMDFSYDYSYDRNGRVTSVSMDTRKSDGHARSFSFKIKYTN